MGLVPTYASIGEWGSYIFIFLRLLQGLSLGAETPGALTYIAESIPDRQGLWCSIVFAFMNFGAVLAMLCHGLVSHVLNAQQFTAWGWRLPFLFGGVLALIGYMIRKNMAESMAFKQQQWKAEIPLVALFQFYPLRLLAAILIACLAGTVIALLYLYMPTYMQSILHYHQNIINLNGIYGLVLYTLMIALFGFVSDKISRRKIIFASAIIIALAAYPSYFILHLQINLLIPFIFTLFAIMAAMLMGSLPSLFTRLFVTQVRYTGVALSYNIGVGISAGLAPLFVTLLIKYTNSIFAPAILLIIACFIGLLGAALVPRKLGLDDS